MDLEVEGNGERLFVGWGSNVPPGLPTTVMRVRATFVCTTGAISIRALSLSPQPLDLLRFAPRFELVPLGLVASALPGTTARASWGKERGEEGEGLLEGGREARGSVD
jgi:hypothetical protein